MTRRPLDQLAGEIAVLEAKIIEAQANGALPAELPELRAADRRAAKHEARARAFEKIGEILDVKGTA
jgi:hypothetical protein